MDYTPEVVPELNLPEVAGSSQPCLREAEKDGPEAATAAPPKWLHRRRNRIIVAAAVVGTLLIIAGIAAGVVVSKTRGEG